MNPRYNTESCITVIKVAAHHNVTSCIDEFQGNFEELQIEVGSELYKAQSDHLHSKREDIKDFLTPVIERLTIAFNHVMGFPQEPITL